MSPIDFTPSSLIRYAKKVSAAPCAKCLCLCNTFNPVALWRLRRTAGCFNSRNLCPQCNSICHQHVRYHLGSHGFNVRGGLERNLKGGCFVAFVKWGGCFDIFCEGYLDITWHLLKSCFTAFLRRAAFTAYSEAAFFAEFFMEAALWYFLVVDQ